MSASHIKTIIAVVITLACLTYSIVEANPQMGYYPHLGMNYDIRQAWMEHQAKPAVEMSKCKPGTVAGGLTGGAIAGMSGGPAGVAVGAIGGAIGGCVSERLADQF